MNPLTQGALRALRLYSFGLAGLLFIIARPLQGQTVCPPPGSQRGDGNDIQCRMKVALEKNQSFLTNAKNKMGSCTHPKCVMRQEHLNRAQRLQERAVRGNNRLRGEDYADLNRKRKGKQSSTSASFSTTGAPDDDVDPSIGLDVADQLDDVASALDQANQELLLPPPPVVTPPVVSNLYDYTGDPNYPAWLHSVDPSTEVEFAAFVVWQATTAAKEMFAKVCDQTIVAAGFGGNTATACLVLWVVASAAEATHEYFDFLGGDTDTWEIHGAYRRAGDIFLNLQSVNTTLGSVAGSVGSVAPLIAQHDTTIRALMATLQTEVHQNNQLLKKIYALERDLMRVILTNDGQKAASPTVLACTGDDCPLVLDCPGAQCKYPIRQ
jgi:hypothetical protein